MKKSFIIAFSSIIVCCLCCSDFINAATVANIDNIAAQSEALNFQYLQSQKLKPNNDFTIFGKISSGLILAVQKSSIQEVTQCSTTDAAKVQALIYLINANDENIQQAVMIADCTNNEMAPRSAILYENFDKEGYGQVTDIYTSPDFCPTQTDFNQFNSSDHFKPIAEYICSVSNKARND